MRNFLSGYLFGLVIGGSVVAAGLWPREPVPVSVASSPIEVTITKTSPVSMAVRGPAKEMLRRNEGVHARVYTDSEGNPTIGVGFNLTRPDAERKIEALGTSKNALVQGRTRLLEAEIEELLDADLTDVLQDLVNLFPDFVEMPQKAQLVLIDLRFNCGPGGLRTFVNTLKSIKTAQWHDAAQRLELSQWAAQVGGRAARAVTLLRGIS